MSSTYSTLKFELITTGEQSGAWGTTTNTNIGTAIEQAIVGMATLTSSDFTTNVATLTLANANTAQNARALCLNIAAGAVSAAGTINVPAIQKPYIIINNSSHTVTVKVSGLTGVAVPSGKRTIVYNNGTDVGNQVDYLASLTLGTALPIASGGTGQVTATAATNALLPSQTSNSGKFLTTDGTNTSWGTVGSGTVTSVAFSGGTTGLSSTGGPITTSGTITLNGTLAVANGGTGLTTAPAADVQTFNSSGTWTKPTGNQTMARIQLWGGGGGGGRTDGGAYIGLNSGGGGGGYNELTVPLSYLASTVSVFVGAAGVGATAGGGGGAGGNTYISLTTAYNGLSTWSAYGGAGGSGATVSSVTLGGAGGGPLGPGIGVTGGTPRFITGFGIVIFSGGGGTLTAWYAGDAGNANAAMYHGGSGFPTEQIGVNSFTQNSVTGSYWGGGGGSMTNSGGTTFAGGVSLYGGSGGTSSAGVAPGGGGSAYYTASTNGNNGAAGRVVITSF
jgi:hypothetical protein